MTVSLHFTAMGALLVHQNGKLVDANAAARSLFKLKDSLADISIFDWFDSDLVSTVLADSEGASIGVAEVELRGADGQAFPAEVCRRQITCEHRAHWRIVLTTCNGSGQYQACQ